jgi:hypothetical protein
MVPRSRISVALVAAATAAALAVSAVTTATATPAPPAGEPESAAGKTYRITLVTGDVAEYTTQPDGRHSARLVGNTGYYTSEAGGELTVVPAAAYGHLQSGTVDRRLFNLTQLVAQGYDDAHTERLPVMVKDTTLRSSGVDKSQASGFWNSFAAKRSPGKLWLDARKDWSVADFPVPGGTASYELSLDVTRAGAGHVGRHVDVHEYAVVVPVRYGEDAERAAVDPAEVRTAGGRKNAVPAAGGSWLELTPGYQPTAHGPGRFRTTAEVSYDGQSWQRLSLVQRGHGTLGAKLPAASAGNDATLRVTVTDRDGNRIVQRIDRAWHLR